MTEEEKPKKRVVSKSKYVAYLVKKTAFLGGSVLLGIGGLCSIALTILCVPLAYIIHSNPDSDFAGIKGEFARGLIIFMITLWVVVSSLLTMGAVAAGKKVKKMEPVLPPTRQNVEQLPAEDILVRASTEPIQEQEKVLLRAATGAEETPPEQLLRPGNAPD
jgi:hypothetical protein